MSNPTQVVGVDPGLVHTGVIRLLFMPDQHQVQVSHQAVAGPSPDPVRQWIWNGSTFVKPHIFIEGYRPRSHYVQDTRMVSAVASLRVATEGTVLLNTGVKKVIRRPLMELLGVWSFPTVTHHQDLRAAARIALFGMLKDPTMNRLIADVVSDHLAGRTWQVVAS